VPPVTHRASNCFALNGDIFNPECDGLDGVIEAYRNCINDKERVSQSNQKYFIKLLITDGIINDM
jgi:hypothetical protein